MRQFFIGFCALLFLFSCGKKVFFVEPRHFNRVEVETLLQDSLLNVRAIEVSGISFYATSNGIIAPILENHLTSSGNLNKIFFDGESNHDKDSVYLNYRSLALTKEFIFALNIGSPAKLIKKKGDAIHNLVYQENHPKAFYDSMDFWNDEEGIAIGDSTDGCLSVIITRDGGNTWNKLTCDMLPKGIENEGAFAASDTNIAIFGSHTWVATNTGRVYYSADKGITWEVFDTPIVKEKETEGIYSIDFYDELNGFAIGGDYTKPDHNAANKIKTIDGGRTWQLVAQNQNPGYRSCVQYIPNRKGEELVTVGFKGIDYSKDAGKTWKHLSNEGFYTIRFLNDSVAYAAGAGRISKLMFRK